ncbi:HAD hydrolase-like protein [Candidatus Beckwithbacteria bacterium]|nr:HAD hydrolase-like protein [Candidatus Beckwithbacteria bacterium]
MIKAVIFDFDDTLVKTRQCRYKALKFAGKHFYDLEITDEKLGKHWGEPFLTFAGNVFSHIEAPELIAKKYFSILHNFPTKAYGEANKLLDKLSGDYKLGVVTAISCKLLKHDAKQAGLNINKFDFIQGEEHSKVHKPNPEVFRPTLEFFSQFGISKNEMVYVGDGLCDWEAARDAGIRFIGVSLNSLRVFDEQKITIAKSLFEIPNLLLN